MTRRQLRLDALGLLESCRELRQAIATDAPDRLPTAQAIVDDAFRAWQLLESKEPLSKISLEFKSRTLRAIILSDALNNPVQ